MFALENPRLQTGIIGWVVVLDNKEFLVVAPAGMSDVDKSQLGAVLEINCASGCAFHSLSLAFESDHINVRVIKCRFNLGRKIQSPCSSDECAAKANLSEDRIEAGL